MKRIKLIALVCVALIVLSAIAWAVTPTMANFHRGVWTKTTIPSGASSLAMTMPGLTASDAIIGTLNTNHSSATIIAIVPSTNAATAYLSEALNTTTSLSVMVIR